MNPHQSAAAVRIAAPFLLLAIAILAAFRARRRSLWMRLAVVVCCLVVVLLPISGLAVCEYFTGIVGETSITLLLLLSCVLIYQVCGLRIIPAADCSATLCVLAVAGLLLYPAAMGLVPADIYRLGYQPTALLLVLISLALWAWISKRNMSAFAVLIAVAAFDLHLLESDNLWDYLTDPLLTLWAWGWVLSWLCACVWRRACRARRV
jgi:hypothetical protein